MTAGPGLSGGAIALPSTPKPGQGWQYAGVNRVQANAVIAADGSGTARFNPLDSDERWHVARVTIVCSGTSSPAPTLRLHVVLGGAAPDNKSLLSGTTCGLFDEADFNGTEGLVVLPGEQLLAVWAGAPVGATATATVQYDYYTQS